jgi:hypothetical protein
VGEEHRRPVVTFSRDVIAGVLAVVVVFALLCCWAVRQLATADRAKEHCIAEGGVICVDQLTGPYVLSKTLP